MAQRQDIDRRRCLEHVTTDNIITIDTYLKCKKRTEILRKISNFEENRMTQHQYYRFRAVLIGEIIFRSAQRSGVVIGMKTSEVANAKIESGLMKIIVYKHKTGKLKPAVVFLEKLATKAFQNFLNNVLPRINCKNDDNFFLSFMGKRITHEGVKISLNSLIKLSGGVGNITSTKNCNETSRK